MALVPALKRIPREIFDQIIKHANPLQSVAFTASTGLEAGDELIWSTIFANDDWLEVVRRKGAKPALLGPNLSSIVAWGMEFAYEQCQPPGTLPGAVGRASVLYQSRSLGFLSEPMPEQMDIIVDRNSLALVGNATAAAVRVGKEIVCSGSDLQITDAELIDGMDWQLVVPTLMYDPVLIRLCGLTVEK